jgi:ankyrin repeat protein
MPKPHLIKNPVKERLKEIFAAQERLHQFAFVLYLTASMGYTDEARLGAATCKQLRKDELLWVPILRQQIGAKRRTVPMFAVKTRAIQRFKWLCDRIHKPLHLNALDSEGHGIVWHAIRHNFLPYAMDSLTDLAVDQPDALGQTPLFYAVANNRETWIRWLLEHGANLHHKCKENMSPMIVASRYATVQTLHQLVEAGCDPTEPAVIYRATRYGRREFVEELLASGASIDTAINGHSLLHCAVLYNQRDLCTLLLNEIHPDIRTEEQVTPLMLVTDDDICRDLYMGGADINAADVNGWAPLHYAVHHRRLEIARTLLDLGAGSTLLTDDGASPLDMAELTGQQSLIALFENIDHE